MRSDRWGVTCSQEVDRFRKTLLPDEAELFNECLMRIYHEPRTDGIHKFIFRLGDPFVYYLYRDDNFVLIYQWTQFKDPFVGYHVKVSQATWTSNFDKDSTIPRL